MVTMERRVQELEAQLGTIRERIDAQAAPSAVAESEAATVEPTLVLQLATLIDSRIDSLRGEFRESAASLRGEFRESAASLRGEFRESAASLRGEFRESAASIRKETASIRKEMRFLAAGAGGLMVTGFLYLNTRVTDLSVALARVETELALLIESLPIQ